MDLGLSRLAGWLRRPRRADRHRLNRPHRPIRSPWLPAPLPEPEGPDEDPPLLGCGWYDSSHELRQGLAVCEQLDACAVDAMPLRDWVDWQLRGVEGVRRPATV